MSDCIPDCCSNIYACMIRITDCFSVAMMPGIYTCTCMKQIPDFQMVIVQSDLLTCFTISSRVTINLDILHNRVCMDIYIYREREREILTKCCIVCVYILNPVSQERRVCKVLNMKKGIGRK